MDLSSSGLPAGSLDPGIRNMQKTLDSRLRTSGMTDKEQAQRNIWLGLS